MSLENTAPCEIMLTNSTFKIKYEEKEDAISIKDSMKKQKKAYQIILFLTLTNSLLNTFSAIISDQWELPNILWSILGICCIGMILFNYFKKTSKNKICLSEILRLQETEFLGRKTYSLQLSNGKSRNLLHLKDHSEIRELKNFLSHLGVQLQ